MLQSMRGYQNKQFEVSKMRSQFGYNQKFCDQQMPRLRSPQNLESMTQDGILEQRANQASMNDRVSNIPNGMNDSMDYQTCTKYEACLKASTANRSRPIDGKQPTFQIPQQFVRGEEPLQIQAQPVLQATLDSHEMDLLIRRNIQKLAAQKSGLRKQEIEKQTCTRLRLKQINDTADQIRSSCRKQQLIKTKRPKWNHSLFVVDPIQSEQTQQKKPILSQSKTESCLKPVSQRISEYKRKQECLRKQLIQKMTCQHKHTRDSEDLASLNEQIVHRANQIIKRRNKQRRTEKDARKAVQSKIKAIALESKANLAKCKKKPLDPNIQFIVEVPERASKKTKTLNTTQQENIIPDVSTKDRYKIISKHGGKKNDRGTLQISNDTNAKKLQDHYKNEEELENINWPTNKFYVWNIPIYRDDYERIDIEERAEQGQVKQKLSFRDEVNQYLLNRNHEKMKDENERAKANQFNKLVAQKKQQLLKQYSESQNLHASDEVYWNEDQLHKSTSIPNFVLV